MLRKISCESSQRWTYINFDLPESLTLASYYLLSCYSNAKALLYGEGAWTQRRWLTMT
ncbi:MAG: hypothetical protein M2R45_01801 [Verrucomicrobia subdivision 3 bacterium]|nr:hypothetical protein [Limisphaerales bacterium]MCS1415844.1 hypothetical protein [Limisphaerales bacterium]